MFGGGGHSNSFFFDLELIILKFLAKFKPRKLLHSHTSNPRQISIFCFSIEGGFSSWYDQHAVFVYIWPYATVLRGRNPMPVPLARFRTFCIAFSTGEVWKR
ncbi:hypothetical protein CDAR_505521 [Caerostris darwini]|uniref:Cytochrome c biogenesis B n=1 Tax=Caerostris darwini TaxID=1538125 RepID=A0AAV4UPA9_9ARAC|nr:hypothetical protein CDAR_505521 [Caerostris darwini]